MKRILSVVVVVCLAVTMTCSNMAVEERGRVYYCPKCGAEAESASYTNHYILTTSVPCTHGYDVRDDIKYYANYTNVTCPNCGVYNTDITITNTVTICNGG